jgi:hypothetical protein
MWVGIDFEQRQWLTVVKPVIKLRVLQAAEHSLNDGSLELKECLYSTQPVTSKWTIHRDNTKSIK